MTSMTPATEQLVRTFESGQIGQAFQQASMIVQQDPQNIVAWRILGHIKQFQGLWIEARQCAIHALRVDPKDAEALLLMAGVLGALGQTDKAVEHCDVVLRDDPANQQALASRAGFLERAGRIDEALADVARLDDPIAAQAEVVRVRALLRQDMHEEALSAADQALAREDVPPRRKYQLFMLKARALDRLGRYDEAFSAAEEGNRLVAPKELDPDHYAKRARLVMETYTAEKWPAFPKNQKNLAEHVFIAGFPRSGTTLVEQILDAHPRAAGVGEAKEIDIFTRSLQQRTGAFVGFPQCAEFAEAPLLEQMAAAYESAMEAHGFGSPSSVVYVNKNLQNLLLLGFIAQLFPKARFILTERDPRDVAVSCFLGQFRAEAMPHLFDMNHIAASIDAAQKLTAHWMELFPERTTLVRYEELVQNHDAEARRVVAAAGLPWDDRCLKFYESERTVMTLAYDQVTRPIYDTSIGRHRHYESRLGSVRDLAPTD